MIGWSASDQQTFEENTQLERERPKSTNMIKQILTIKYLERIDNAENRIYQKINWYPQNLKFGSLYENVTKIIKRNYRIQYQLGILYKGRKLCEW